MDWGNWPMWTLPRMVLLGLVGASFAVGFTVGAVAKHWQGLAK
jgi:hypothetical protein